MAVNQAVTSLGRNVILDDRPPAINISEKELTRKEPSSSNDHDTVGLMEQTCGRNPGTQLSRGRNTRLRWTRLKGKQQQQRKHRVYSDTNGAMLRPGDRV